MARTVSVVAFVRANYDLAGLKELAAGIGADGINVSNKNVAALNLGSFVVRRCRESEFLDVLAKTPPAAPKPIALPTPSPLPPFDVSDAQSSKKTLYPWLMGHNKEALRDLAAAIGMDPDNLPEDQSESARELFLFSERRLLHPALVALASGESPTPALLAARKQLRAELASAQDTMSLYKFLDTHFEGEELSFLELPLGLPGTGTIMRRAQALAESGQTNPTLAEAMAREMGISEH